MNSTVIPIVETSSSRPGVVAIGIAAVLLIVMYLIARKKRE